MNEVRKRILESITPYKDFAEHKDLMGFVVGGEYFNYDYETDTELELDFDEVVVAVEKDWLFALMKNDGIENPLDFLQNEYTYDDSIEWFNKASMEGKIAVIEFN